MERLHIILDESSSMANMSHAAYEGSKELVSSVLSDGTVCLTRFNQIVTLGEDMTPEYAKDNILERPPNGQTALYDAIYTAIHNDLVKYSTLTKVTIAIVTDGIENTSSRTIDDVKGVIKLCDDKGWRTVFMGANQDAILTANSFGIRGDRALTYGNTPAYMGSAFTSLNAANERFSSGGNESFTPVERSVSNTTTSSHRSNLPTSIPLANDVTSSVAIWVSVDPRTGNVVRYDPALQTILEEGFNNQKGVVTIPSYNASIFLDHRSGRHMQKTTIGERDVRRVQLGDTLFIKSFGDAGYRLTMDTLGMSPTHIVNEMFVN